jgi:chlorobactene glucosyltransferase
MNESKRPMERDGFRNYHRIVLGLLGLLGLNFASNLLALRTLADVPEETIAAGDAPLVSLLVPARDEERAIGACAAALLAQRYPHCEILVLDDESRDRTAAIVADLAATHPNLQLLQGAPLPPGWLGKSFACWQLAQASAGDYLLFTDADTVLAPHAVVKALALARSHDLGLLTALPRHQAITWGERLILPLVAFNTLTLLPVPLANRLQAPSLSAGMGPFLFFRRDAYLASGGHAAVRDLVLEDVHLARRTKAAGARVWFVDGAGAVTSRMYYSFSEVWQGFSKNLFAFYGYSLPAALLAIGANMALYVAPPLLLIAGLWRYRHADPHAGMLGFAAAETALGLGMRLALAARFGDSLISALLHPLGTLLQSAITLNAIRWSRQRIAPSGGGARGAVGYVAWKGRTYAVGAGGIAQSEDAVAPPPIWRPE